MKTELRPLWKDILAAIWLGMVLPGIILHACILLRAAPPESPQEIPVEQERPSMTIMLLQTEDGSSRELDIGQYLTGVLLAEMPASFEPEALKAQSVAARTYTVKACLTGGKHGNGSLCDNPGCCQGFISEEAYFSQGGTQESLDKVKQAVSDTAPLVLKYDGELIEAVYFSSSGGRTESALAVWGSDFPYLQSVESPGETATAYQNRIKTITAESFQNQLGIQLTGKSEEWFSDVNYTEGGGVAHMTIGGTVFSGTQLRSLLELPSTAFTLTAEGETVTVTSSGYGHRVGLSQYGANSMAQAGSRFDEILAHYYPGTVLISMES